ncbi:MAG TPA: sterol desaturase family protein [Caulobacteraceae bacterium]|nr:sterol desaturase family protein [Caulobacteraceae bacterium]
MDTTWLLHVACGWLASVVRDGGRYAVFSIATWAILWVFLKDRLKDRKIRKATPPARQLVIEFLVSMRSVAVFATATIAMILASKVGLYPLAGLAHAWGPVWFWLSLVLMILGHDAYYYWTHRAMHARALAGVHRRHHRSANPSPFTAYSFSVGEALLMVSFVLIWPLAVPTPWGVIPLFIIHQIARNTLAHCGYELMPARRDGRPWLDWMTTTTHHDLHHVQAGYNFGLYFTWWDRWMKTEHPDYHAAFARAAARRTKLAKAPAGALPAS